jgi:hypothetical protein
MASLAHDDLATRDVGTHEQHADACAQFPENVHEPVSLANPRNAPSLLPITQWNWTLSGILGCWPGLGEEQRAHA